MIFLLKHHNFNDLLTTFFEKLTVFQLFVPQNVTPTNHHNRRGKGTCKGPSILRSSVGGEWVAEMVVSVASRGQCQPPHQIRDFQCKEGPILPLLPLGSSPCLPSEIGTQQNQSSDSHISTPILPARPHSQAMCDVPSCAVAHKEYLGEVCVGIEPGIDSSSSADGHRLRMEPLECRDGIVVSRREAMLGSQSIVDGDDEGAYIGCPLYAEVVKIGSPWGIQTEAAAMKVKDYGQACGGGGRTERREIEARPQGGW
jgi:hypothetical protein